jgi:hypothetical protein
MEEVPFILLIGIFFAVAILIFRDWAISPRQEDIKWIFDRPGRKSKLAKNLQNYIDAIAFFLIASLLGMISKAYLDDHSSLLWLITSSALAIVLFVSAQLTIGKINTFNLIDNKYDYFLKFIIMVSFIICAVIVLPIVPNIYLPKINKILAFQSLLSIIFLIIFSIIFAWKLFALQRLSEMIRDMDTYIKDHFQYCEAAKILRETSLGKFIKKNSLSNDKEILANVLATQISNKLEKTDYFKKYLLPSRIHNYFYYGLNYEYSIFPYLCAKRIINVIYYSVLFKRNRWYIALFQELINSKKIVEVGFNCQRYSETMYEKCLIINYEARREFYLEVVLKSGKYQNETLKITEDNLVYIKQ